MIAVDIVVTDAIETTTTITTTDANQISLLQKRHREYFSSSSVLCFAEAVYSSTKHLPSIHRGKKPKEPSSTSRGQQVEIATADAASPIIPV